MNRFAESVQDPWLATWGTGALLTRAIVSAGTVPVSKVLRVTMFSTAFWYRHRRGSTGEGTGGRGARGKRRGRRVAKEGWEGKVGESGNKKQKRKQNNRLITEARASGPTSRPKRASKTSVDMAFPSPPSFPSPPPFPLPFRVPTASTATSTATKSQGGASLVRSVTEKVNFNWDERQRFYGRKGY